MGVTLHSTPFQSSTMEIYRTVLWMTKYLQLSALWVQLQFKTGLKKEVS